MKEIASRTRIKRKSRRKTNPYLVKTISLAMKHKPWLFLAHKLSGPTRMFPSFNLSEIDLKSGSGEKLIVAGKVLSSGELSKKISICGLFISKRAREKLKKSGSEFISLSEEIKNNPEAKGIRLLQ